MAVDPELNERFRQALPASLDTTEKTMMGGVCFLLNGKMIGGADRTKAGTGCFMFRLGKDNDALGAAMPGAQPMIQGGRRMSGFYFVAETCESQDLADWAKLAVNFAKTLPAK